MFSGCTVNFREPIDLLQKSIRHREAASACHGVVVRFVGEVSVKLLLFGRTTVEILDVQQLYFAEAYSFCLTAEHSGSTTEPSVA